MKPYCILQYRTRSNDVLRKSFMSFDEADIFAEEYHCEKWGYRIIAFNNKMDTDNPDVLQSENWS